MPGRNKGSERALRRLEDTTVNQAGRANVLKPTWADRSYYSRQQRMDLSLDRTSSQLGSNSFYVVV